MSIADRIADLQGDRGMWGSIFFGCFNAIGTVGCRATGGTIPSVSGVIQFRCRVELVVISGRCQLP